MFYLFPLAFIAAIALAIWFVLISDATLVAKILVGALFILSFFLHPSRFPLAGFFFANCHRYLCPILPNVPNGKIAMKSVVIIGAHIADLNER